jgi:hypothetical protein
LRLTFFHNIIPVVALIAEAQRPTNRLSKKHRTAALLNAA